MTVFLDAVRGYFAAGMENIPVLCRGMCGFTEIQPVLSVFVYEIIEERTNSGTTKTERRKNSVCTCKIMSLYKEKHFGKYFHFFVDN
jgi:hypothetical protein